MAAVKIEHVTKKIHGRAVLDDIDLEIPDGSVVGFTGVNGSGKSMVSCASTEDRYLSAASCSTA